MTPLSKFKVLNLILRDRGSKWHEGTSLRASGAFNSSQNDFGTEGVVNHG